MQSSLVARVNLLGFEKSLVEMSKCNANLVKKGSRKNFPNPCWQNDLIVFDNFIISDFLILSTFHGG
jgi:hypothetical protein